MKLALLGIDEESLALVRWAVAEGGHQLVAAFDAGLHAQDVKAIAPAAIIGETWEELLLGKLADAVIVGRGGAGLTQETGIPDGERRADQLRKLAQAAVPMIVVCPACEAIIGYEIEMIRCDVGGIIVPYIPGAAHEAIDRLATYLAASEKLQIGPVEQISLEREQTCRDREPVLVQLARDATLLRQLIGAIQTVSASGPQRELGRDPMGPKPKQLPSLANLSVTFGGQRHLPARWSVGPAVEGDRGRLTVICERMKVFISMAATGDWLVHYTGDKTETATLNISDAAVPFTQLAFAKAGHQRYDDSAWLSACRDQEAAEAVDRSLARGRTIELFNEEHTEESSFKGVMAMGGCLLLMLALAGVLVATLVDSLRLPLRDFGLWRMWPVFLLAPLALFLALQLLQTVIKRDRVPTDPLLENSVSGK